MSVEQVEEDKERLRTEDFVGVVVLACKTWAVRDEGQKRKARRGLAGFSELQLLVHGERRVESSVACQGQKVGEGSASQRSRECFRTPT